MRIFYTIYHALAELKRQIQVLEKELKQDKSGYGRLTKLSSMEWLFERGISLIENTNPKDKADLLDFFQDKSRLRKDIKDEKAKLEKQLLE
jgi:predicted transcriptional regulator